MAKCTNMNLYLINNNVFLTKDNLFNFVLCKLTRLVRQIVLEGIRIIRVLI